MKFNKIPVIILALILLLLPVNAVAAVACACCAEPGEYSISVKKPNTYDLSVLEEIQFATANLYTNAGSPENILGIAPLGDDYSIKALFQNKGWKFDFKDNAGKTGTLSLPLPTSMVAFMADLHDGAPGQIEPVLYKEWRFKFKVGRGTGIFQKGIAPLTEYFLVLQGRGNNCTSSIDFKNWRLEITGRKASYAFYGNLKNN